VAVRLDSGFDLVELKVGEGERNMTTVATLPKAPVLEDYFGASDADLHERIERARRTLGERLVILGHHYQRDDEISHAKIIGDT